jgi:hypothetical protein
MNATSVLQVVRSARKRGDDDRSSKARRSGSLYKSFLQLGGTIIVYKRVSIVGVALTVLALGLGRFEAAKASSVPQFPACHDDSTMVKQQDRQGGGPTHLTGSDTGDHGYYYLTITAGCPGDAPRSTVTLTVQIHLSAVLSGTVDADGMCWGIHVDKGYNHNPVAAGLIMGNDVSLVYNQAVAGTQYRIRIANMEEGVTVAEHSSVDG